MPPRRRRYHLEVRRFSRHLTLLWFAALFAGCSSPADNRGDGAIADATDAVDATDARDVATEAPVADVRADRPADTSSPDRVDLDAAVACDSMTCAAGEICVHEKGGVDASPVEDHCYALPGGCDGVPSCTCITSLSFRCGMTCQQLGEREFRCNGA